PPADATARRATRSPGSRTTSTRRAVGGMVRMSATGSPPNANSRITIGRRQREPSRTERDIIMKLVIIGGTGLIGSKLVAKLRDHGHEAVPAVELSVVRGEGRDGLLHHRHA